MRLSHTLCVASRRTALEHLGKYGAEVHLVISVKSPLICGQSGFGKQSIKITRHAAFWGLLKCTTLLVRVLSHGWDRWPDGLRAWMMR